MTKLTKLALASTILTSGLYAQNAKDVHIGVSTAKVQDESYTEFNIGYGLNAHFNSFLLGTSLGFAYGSPKIDGKSIDVATAYVDFRLGYGFFDNKLSIYAIGTAALQGIDGNDGAGFGYGGGIDYSITDNFGINLEYKTHDMMTSSVDYTYEKANLNLKYTF
ncbi:outer membrane beta-barrel protein [Aliarcobacter lanthieri]|uniref:outer membrane beta-barrel protein n=1 Tax=Aliarcobacter lanthieri TaxID=1355374 RepID=UPI003AACECF7